VLLLHLREVLLANVHSPERGDIPDIGEYFFRAEIIFPRATPPPTTETMLIFKDTKDWLVKRAVLLGAICLYFRNISTLHRFERYRTHARVKYKGRRKDEVFPQLSRSTGFYATIIHYILEFKMERQEQR
jgi:hypothetical protein